MVFLPRHRNWPHPKNRRRHCRETQLDAEHQEATVLDCPLESDFQRWLRLHFIARIVAHHQSKVVAFEVEFALNLSAKPVQRHFIEMRFFSTWTSDLD